MLRHSPPPTPNHIQFVGGFSWRKQELEQDKKKKGEKFPCHARMSFVRYIIYVVDTARKAGEPKRQMPGIKVE